MLERDFEDALVNYSDGDYELAAIQLSTILDNYSKYSNNLDSVHFYRAESYFARLLYKQAEKDYVAVVRNFPDTDHLGDSLPETNAADSSERTKMFGERLSAVRNAPGRGRSGRIGLPRRELQRPSNHGACRVGLPREDQRRGVTPSLPPKGPTPNTGYAST